MLFQDLINAIPKNELCVLGKLVLRGSRIVIPKATRGEVVRHAHDRHQGVVKIKARLRTKVCWPKMDVDAEQVCKFDHGCQVVGDFQPPELMKRTEPPTRLWQDRGKFLCSHRLRQQIL